MRSFSLLRSPLLLLRLASFFVLIGRGWQFIRWDAPLRTLFWDQYLMEPVVRLLTGWDWQTYATNLHVDQVFGYVQQGIGWLYVITAFSALWMARNQLLRYLLYISTAMLLFTTLLYWKEQAYSIGQLLELTTQWTTPLFFALAIQQKMISPRLILMMKIAVAATFVGHGLYAFGYYPVPGNFVQMMITVFGVQQEVSLVFLKMAGILDFALGAAIFLPWRKLVQVALAYAVFWGFVTALARIISNFYWTIPLQSMEQWAHETVFRLPHALIPLVILVIVCNKKHQ